MFNPNNWREIIYYEYDKTASGDVLEPKLVKMNILNGSKQVLVEGTYFTAPVTWSKSGLIAYVEHGAASTPSGEIIVMNEQGQEVERFSSGFPSTLSNVNWAAKGDELYFVGGYNHTGYTTTLYLLKKNIYEEKIDTVFVDGEVLNPSQSGFVISSKNEYLDIGGNGMYTYVDLNQPTLKKTMGQIMPMLTINKGICSFSRDNSYYISVLPFTSELYGIYKINVLENTYERINATCGNYLSEHLDIDVTGRYIVYEYFGVNGNTDPYKIAFVDLVTNKQIDFIGD